MSGHEDAEQSRRIYHGPYTQRRPIPTISKYEKEKEARQAQALPDESAEHTDGADLHESKTARAKQSWRDYWDGGEGGEQKSSHDQSSAGADGQDGTEKSPEDERVEEDEEAETVQDTSEIAPVAQDPKKARKAAKKNRNNRAEREVTDPITHLPVRIYDFTTESLEEVEENPLPWGSTLRTATGLSNKRKDTSQLNEETREIQHGLESMNALFPPPSFDTLRTELISINKLGITVGLIGTAAIILLAVALEHILTPNRLARWTNANVETRWWIFKLGAWLVLGAAGTAAILELVAGVRVWMANRIDDVWEEQVWEANLEAREREAKAHETESVAWLNSLLSSVWPLVNPDLFVSLADTLEDVMQASLPRIVQMVSVEDIGQGSEALQILGVRWLPSGAAARSVGQDGKLQKKDKEEHKSDRTVPGEGEVDNRTEKQDNEQSGSDDDKGDGTERAEVAEGLEAEEGDFINLEVAFAYRARAAKSFQDRTKDIHLYLAFYLPGGLKFPVWVDMKGIVGTCRLRLQLTPDPPFFSLCTITFLGQPKVDMSCIPIVKRGLNIMDLPLISKFVQSSVDAAMAEYVAPKSLTLDLKDMLAGDDFKKDTNARGIVVVDIMHGYDFRMGDAAIPLISEGGSDPYVSVGWAKFGKPMFSTRVLIKEMEPYWHERCYLLVTPEELNVDERLRVQLWDSDRFTADDDLGRIEVDLKQIMRSDDTNGKLHYRTDGFKALKAGENMPGKLEWRVGYFSKTRLQACQFKKQTFDESIKSQEDLNKKVDDVCRKKLREAMIKKGRHSRTYQELEQQKAQEKKTFEDAMTISAPPPDGYRSGIFSMVLHQITGLELETKNKANADKNSAHEDEEEEGDTLPSAYCTVIINHRKVFKTRTKPKNAKPFYNAGTERFIGDWQNAEVHVTVRDARPDEGDALLGIVHLPLGEIFKHRSQINGFYPLTGGVGYGRIRLSMVWRSVQLQAEPERIGWDYGTIEISPSISTADVPADLKDLKIKWHSNITSAKMYPNKEEQSWRSRKARPLYLPVHRRYATCLSLRIKRNGRLFGKDKTAAFAVLWLRDIADDDEKELTLPIYTGDYDRAISCTLDKPGEQVGSIKVKITFWSGLGAGHQRWASKDTDLKQVMEVLDTARDNYEAKKNAEHLGITEGDGNNTSDSDSSSDSSDEDDESFNDSPPVKGTTTNGTTPTASDTTTSQSNDNDDGHMNLIDKAKEYKKHAKQKHRKQRGLMQYKPARNAQWAKEKLGRVESKVESLFSRHTREPGIETEV
ncbi:putative C2 domain, synaptotagmin-like mitochondrial-lipid-binding domain, C2 domain superfamily [Septoria linicola]|nr:putative C2 domain, synaptotagmin-like mitochondrial-lipid-binding domain, C2 domain superfamily [Septoria linicola]